MASEFEPRPVDKLKMTGEQRRNVLRVLNERGKQGKDAGLRKSARRAHQWHEAPLLYVLNEEGQPGLPQSVIGRDVSEGGVALVLGEAVEVGCRCVVTLTLGTGIKTDKPGTVRRCSPVAGRIHEIGVCFDEPLDMGLLCGVQVSERSPELAIGSGAAAADENEADLIARIEGLSEKLARTSASGGLSPRVLMPLAKLTGQITTMMATSESRRAG